MWLLEDSEASVESKVFKVYGCARVRAWIFWFVPRRMLSVNSINNGTMEKYVGKTGIDLRLGPGFKPDN